MTLIRSTNPPTIIANCCAKRTNLQPHNDIALSHLQQQCSPILEGFSQNQTLLVFPWQLDAHLYACMCLWRLAMSAWF
jgi:hypothetical protein